MFSIRIRTKALWVNAVAKVCNNHRRDITNNRSNNPPHHFATIVKALMDSKQALNKNDKIMQTIDDANHNTNNTKHQVCVGWPDEFSQTDFSSSQT